MVGSSTLARFIIEEQRKHPNATGNFTVILEQIAFTAKLIGNLVRQAGIADIIGAVGSDNVHGEHQQKLDIYANTKFIQSMDHIGLLCGMASEEEDDVIQIPSAYPKGDYLIVFDPLDGSSNIDVNISIGTIFGVYKKKGALADATAADFMQKGRELVAAGYVLYGSSTMLVYSTGQGVNGFTLDPSVGEFMLSHQDMKIPECGAIYSANEGNFDNWAPEVREYIHALRGNKERSYTARYVGSLVADFHRTLLKGGIFLYPEDSKNKNGKLRLLYEATPLAFLAEQAGGLATDGNTDILDITPNAIHQRTAFVAGSKYEVALYKEYRKGR